MWKWLFVKQPVKCRWGGSRTRFWVCEGFYIESLSKKFFGVPVLKNWFWQTVDKNTLTHQKLSSGPSPSTFYGSLYKKSFSHLVFKISAVIFPEMYLKNRVSAVRRFLRDFGSVFWFSKRSDSWNCQLEAQEELLVVRESITWANKQTQHHIYFSAVYFSAKTVPGVCHGARSSCQRILESLQTNPHYTATAFLYSDRKSS